MDYLPKQVKANDEVFKFWLKKKQWTRNEFASLYCGINPFAWRDDQSCQLYDREKQISEEKETEIKDLLTLIDHRLELHLSMTNTPSYWKQTLPVLELAMPNWLFNDKAEHVIKIESVDMQEKPLGTRERNTLLVIIAALAKEAKIDLSKPSKAGEAIAHLTEILGAPVDHATIEQKINLINEAVQARTK
jgi:hypothetical protein